MDELDRWVGLSVSTADGQTLGEVRGSLWSEASGAAIIGVTGTSGVFLVAATPAESHSGLSVSHTFDFIANGPTVNEIDRIFERGGLHAAVSKLDDYYEVGFAIPPGPPGRSTSAPDWLRDITEADPVPTDEPAKGEQLRGLSRPADD